MTYEIGEIDLKKDLENVPKVKTADVPYVYVRPAFVTQINSLAWLEGE